MNRRVVGDTHHTEGALVNRLLLETRASVRATEVEAWGSEPHFNLSSRKTRANVRRAGNMCNAPLLIRLVRHPFRLRRAYFTRNEVGGAKRTVEARENFGVREILDSRVLFEAGSPVGGRVRAESPTRASVEAWLNQEVSCG
jgi:hypothetical protein